MQSLMFMTLTAVCMGSPQVPADEFFSLSGVSWLAKAQSFATEAPLYTELKMLQAYTYVRQHPIVAVLCFYLLLLCTLRKLTQLCRKSPSLHFRVIHEASSTDLLSNLKSELKALKLDFNAQDRIEPSKAIETPTYVRQIGVEVQRLFKSHNDFQIGMIDCHKDLWQALSDLQDKATCFEAGRPPITEYNLSPIASKRTAEDFAYKAPMLIEAFGSVAPQANTPIIEEAERLNMVNSSHSSRKNSKSLEDKRQFQHSDLPKTETWPLQSKSTEQRGDFEKQSAVTSEVIIPVQMRPVPRSNKTEARIKIATPPALTNPFMKKTQDREPTLGQTNPFTQMPTERRITG